jgi:murein L,D-transpeptidase YafK
VKKWVKIALLISLVCLFLVCYICKTVSLKAGFFVSIDKKEKMIEENKIITSIVVHKKLRKMTVYNGNEELKSYKISLGKTPEGHKQFEGDNKTPEGIYVIFDKNPNSAYHKNLGISYPNEKDVAFAKKQGKQPGGEIKIHGLPNGKSELGKIHLLSDWTAGCIAVTSDEIDELYKHVEIGIPIEILP